MRNSAAVETGGCQCESGSIRGRDQEIVLRLQHQTVNYDLID